MDIPPAPPDRYADSYLREQPNPQGLTQQQERKNRKYEEERVEIRRKEQMNLLGRAFY